MSARGIALTIWAAGVVMVVGSLALVALELAAVQRMPAGSWPTIAITLVVELSLGALIAVRRSQNPIGWILLGSAFLGLTSTTASAYARYDAPGGSGTLPFAEWTALWASVWGRAGTAAPFFAILLFPTGTLPSSRWRWVLLLGCLSIFGFLLRALSPEATAAYGIANPIGVPGWPKLIGQGGIGGLPLFGFVIAVLASLIVRFRRASIVERQQLKWLLAGGVTLIVPLAANVALTVVGLDEAVPILSVPYGLSGIALTAAMTIAILRYRLYDIDLLINRTLVYGGTVAILAALYIGAIVAVETALQPFTQGSELAVAVSTLTAVALFTPIRTRIQRGVDRRFYRSRYDATRTLASLALRLRDEVDLDALRSELLSAVGDTMQPAHASLWLRERAK